MTNIWHLSTETPDLGRAFFWIDKTTKLIFKSTIHDLNCDVGYVSGILDSFRSIVDKWAYEDDLVAQALNATSSSPGGGNPVEPSWGPGADICKALDKVFQNQVKFEVEE